MAQSPPNTDTNIIANWATFTHGTSRIRKITNLFKHANVKIAFRSSNAISQLTKSDSRNSTPSYDESSIYKLTCNTCKLAYIGQTSGSVKFRYQEYIHYIRNNNPQFAYTQNILHSQHEYGTMDNIMTLPKPLNNTAMLIPYEQLFIRSLHQERKLIAEQYPGEQTPLFQLVIDPSYTSHDVTEGSTSP